MMKYLLVVAPMLALTAICLTEVAASAAPGGVITIDSAHLTGKAKGKKDGASNQAEFTVTYTCTSSSPVNIDVSMKGGPHGNTEAKCDGDSHTVTFPSKVRPGEPTITCPTNYSVNASFTDEDDVDLEDGFGHEYRQMLVRCA
ncbi:hypothetical protein AB0M22_08400 [Nocardia sp. NPDC051756]|uniref:hypothetical protein n=1 Tax=Nocardia sp. NPDC051756 TaxID=3154751 RepID=UPI00343C6AD2